MLILVRRCKKAQFKAPCLEMILAPKPLKKILYWTISALALGLVILSVLISYLDWNRYRETLSDIASAQMNMQVELAGNVTVSLTPRPSISAETVRIAPRGQGSGGIVATADKISIRLGVASFLKGRIAVQGLVLEGLSAALDETPTGIWRVRGWPETSGEASVDLTRIDIRNGKLILQPYGSIMRKAEQINLQFKGTLPTGPMNWDGSFILDGQAVETSGRLKPVLLRDEVSIKADIKLAESNIAVSGRIATNGDMTARLRLDGPRLGDVYSAANTLTASGPGARQVPNIPYEFDLQLDVNGGIAKLVSRQLQLAETRGRLDLTIARKAGMNHLAGSLSLGVIDVDAWQAALPTASVADRQPSQLSPKASHMALSGAVDVTVEGIRMNGGLGQRIDAVVALRPEGPVITSLQALLPGAATLSVSGDLHADFGEARLRIAVGDVGDLADWAGLDLPDTIPEGRLSTASATATLMYQGDQWMVSELEGLLDTSKIYGALSGVRGNLVPTHVKVKLDQLDLDIFAANAALDKSEANLVLDKSTGKPSEQGSRALVRVPENVDMTLDITANVLHGFKATLGHARFVGALKSGKLDIDFLTLEQGDSSLKIEGSLANDGDDVALALQADFTKWGMHIGRYFIPELQAYLLAADMDTLDGKASATGTYSKMRLGFDASTQDNLISLSGEIGFPKNRLTFVELQGALKHSNLAGVARLGGYGDFKNLPAQLTYALSKEGQGRALDIKLGGDFADGKMQAEIRDLDGLQRLKVTYDHKNVALLEEEIGRDLDGLDPSKGLRAEIEALRGDEGWTITIPSIKNGDRALSGTLIVSDDHRFSGALDVAEIMLAVGARAAAEGESRTGAYLRALGDYAGTIALNLKNISLVGQQINAPSARLSVGDGSARLTFGPEATLNLKPVDFLFGATLEKAVPFTLETKFEAFNFAGLFASEGVPSLVQSSVKGQVSLKGKLGDTKSVIATLGGEGNIEGAAGQLRFLSVGGILSTMQTARSGRRFLSSVGDLLRTGETPFATLNGKFSIDSGVMLVETAKASADWGSLTLDGQINLPDRFLALSGALKLINPPDTPALDVRYEGPFEGASAKWVSRSFERFVIAGIERRLRNELFQEMETRQAKSGKAPGNPGLAVFTRAFGMLTQLKSAQAAKKKAEQEARRKAEEQQEKEDELSSNSVGFQGIAGQKP